MISVKCPTCGLVDWNVGNCKRCETPLAGLGAEGFAHNLEVSGGAERIARLRSFRTEGRLTFKGGEAEGGAEAAGGHVTFLLHAKAPDKIQTQIEMGPPAEPEAPADEPPTAPASYSPSEPPAPSAPKLRVSLRRGFDGSRGWEFVERAILADGSTVPVKQYASRELNGGELRKLKRYAQTAGLAQLAGEYTSFKLKGREPVTWATGGEVMAAGRELVDKALRGHEAYVVSGVNREGRSETLYFDTQTGLLLRTDFEAEDEEGEAVVVACAFADYGEVGGLKLPHRLHFKWGEESMTLNFDKYLPNEFVPDSAFEMPEAAD